MAQAQEKKITKNAFADGVNSDIDEQKLPPSFARFMINCRLFDAGGKGVIRLPMGNTPVANTFLPAGTNMCIGWVADAAKQKFYWFNYNSGGYHAIYCYNDVTQTVTPVLQNIYDTGGIDVLKFSPTSLINHVDLIADNLLYWVDGLNKARKTNIAKSIDKTTTGYGSIILEDFITAYKKTAIFAPSYPTRYTNGYGYFTDVTRSSNYLYGLQFRFAQRYYYDDGEVSNVSDFSPVALPAGESYLGTDNITYNNNCIQVQVETGSLLVTKIEILVQMTDGTVTLPWQSCIILDKTQLQIANNSRYIYSFYNDNPMTAVDQNKVVRPYSFLPRVPYAQAFVRLAMTYMNAAEGFPAVQIAASVAVTSQNLYLPSGTTSQMNSPSFTVSQTGSTVVHGGFLAGDSYYQTVTHIIIGHDVKAGNVFTMTGKNNTGTFGHTQDNYSWKYAANRADSAQTVAAIVKTWLRSTGRGVPDKANGISNEVTDGSGNVSFDFTYLGHDNTGPTVFFGSVTPVNYISLTNNGVSINVIKSGSPRKYAIVYSDDDGRESLAYTCDGLLAKTPFITQWGTPTLQQPLHNVTITSQPPLWAYYWRLVRTKDLTDFVQMLIQKVVLVSVPGEGDFLDLVIGSIGTYQLIHPNTVVQYQFKQGDRLRLIRDENSGNLYTPYFETTVVSYKDSFQQTINENITCSNGSNLVTPQSGPKTDNIGKYIIINGVQRTITGVSGSNYQLDEPFNPVQTYTTTAVTTATYPNYILLDTRGIVRINRPPATINLLSLALVEIAHPQVTQLNDSGTRQAQNFYDCGMKFMVANPGTAQAAHRGNVQDQDGNNPATTPCIVQVSEGDCYVRQRALPINSPVNAQDAQVVVDTVEDSNYSDFYYSSMHSLGRVYPQDNGKGTKLFDQRVRYSNNYIQNTAINGLNDFDAEDYRDYNDIYGSIMLARYRRDMLYMFKALKTTWTPIGANIVVDNAAQGQLATSSKLLNTLQYAVWDGGIGQGGAWAENGDYMYITSAGSGVILRIAHDGSIPISRVFGYDSETKKFLAAAMANGLQIMSQYDKLTDEVLFAYPAYTQYLFNGGFDPRQWQMMLAAYPTGTTWAIIAQPANAVAAISGTNINITGTNTLGADFFTYQGTLPGGGTTPVMKFCFTVVAETGPTGWQGDGTTLYCVKSSGANTGTQNFAVLNQIFTQTGNASGFKMPNIQSISTDAIVPTTATITFNAGADVTPTGGVNGDIWYNFNSDNLYKNISGTWTLLVNRSTNSYYIPEVQNLTACPLPPPPPPPGNTETVNNNSSNFTISYVNVTGYPSLTTIGPGQSKNQAIAAGSGYTVSVKVLPSTNGQAGTLSISSNGTVTNYAIPAGGLTVSQTGVSANIIVQLTSP